MIFPNSGETVEIHSYKHNGKIHRTWEEMTILKGSREKIIGANDRTLVTEADGRTWHTREPSICYFDTGNWYNVIGMIRPDGIYYYCNLGSPFIIEDGVLKYIDYDLDIKVFPDRTFAILDEDEYEMHRRLMNYPPAIDRILQKNMEALIQNIRTRRGPFAPDFVDKWYDQYLMMR